MKWKGKIRRTGIIFMIALCCLVMLPTQPAKAVIWAVVKAAIIKAIKAIDLAIQKQQNKVIWLQNAQKTIENTMSKLKLDEITGWVEKQRDLYKDYFEELNKVKTLITYYQQIRDITNREKQLIAEYQRCWNLLKNDRNFTPEEVDYMSKVYQGILDDTVKNIDQLAMIINSFRTQMSDAKRLEIINTVGENVEQNFADLKKFNTENAMLSVNRTVSKEDVLKVRKLYGIE